MSRVCFDRYRLNHKPILGQRTKSWGCVLSRTSSRSINVYYQHITAQSPQQGSRTLLVDPTMSILSEQSVKFWLWLCSATSLYPHHIPAQPTLINMCFVNWQSNVTSSCQMNCSVFVMYSARRKCSLICFRDTGGGVTLYLLYLWDTVMHGA